MRIHEFSGPDQLGPWRDRWRRLAHDCNVSYFQSPEWVSAWNETCEPGTRLIVLADGPEDDPDGLLVLSPLHRRVHHSVSVGIDYVGLAGSGLGAADHLGPIARSDASSLRLLQTAASYAGQRPLVLSNLAARHRAAALRLPGAVEVSTKRCPVLDLSGATSTSDVWSTKFVKNLRRRNRLMESSGLRRRWTHGGPQALAAIEDLRRVHVARWQSRGQSGLFDEQRRRLLTDLAGRVEGDEGLWVETIEGDEGVVAALLGFQYAGTFCSYKTGWDPSLHRLGVGILLHSGAIERAVSLGLTRYDFLRGAESHKYSLGGVDEVNGTIVVPNGVQGQVLLARDRLSELVSVRASRRHADVAEHVPA